MALSRKCYYAIRAVYELTRCAGDGRPVKIADIASAQDIPVRFLEAILNELRAGGFVESRRGADGGYLLAPDRPHLSVGHVVEYVEGPIKPAECIMGRHQTECKVSGRCVFLPAWKQIHQQIADAYYQMKFKDLVEHGRRGAGGQEYAI